MPLGRDVPDLCFSNFPLTIPQVIAMGGQQSRTALDTCSMIEALLQHTTRIPRKPASKCTRTRACRYHRPDRDAWRPELAPYVYGNAPSDSGSGNLSSNASPRRSWSGGKTPLLFCLSIPCPTLHLGQMELWARARTFWMLVFLQWSAIPVRWVPGHHS